MLFFPVLIPFNSLFLFFYFSSICLTNFFLSHCRKSISPSHTEFNEYSVDSSEEGDVGFFSSEHREKEDLVADIILGGEALLFLPPRSAHKDPPPVQEGEEHEDRDSDVSNTPVLDHISELEYFPESRNDEEDAPENLEEVEDSDQKPMRVSTSKPTPLEPYHEIVIAEDTLPKNKGGPCREEKKYEKQEEIKDDSQDEGFLVIDPLPEKVKFDVLETSGEEIPVGSFAGGSTSNSSYEWRSSTNYRGSETEDPFSSSSRRSSSKWEKYTVFRKYDEEMMFLDRISAQKLTETESLRSVQIHPRSVPQRIVHKLSTMNKQLPEKGRDPYQELEAAYVAQICLTWEALNWNYKNFHRLKATQSVEDSGCLAQIAQQFQQFQVLLQRFIENEPYEHGHRPEIYARMRTTSPKLLQVPEFQDSEAGGSKEDSDAKISSAEFLLILEDAIRTFMNFLKADKRSHCQILRSFFKKSQTSVDPTLLRLIKKAVKKKKMKLKDLRRSRKCFKRRNLKPDDEMEILMGLIDLKIVSRALRMPDISNEQLHWCEEKMSNVRVWEGKLQRDSSPLFFPSH